MGSIEPRSPQRFGLAFLRKMTERLRRTPTSPAATASAPDLEPSGTTVPPTGPAPAVRRVLVIEDDAIVRLGLQAVLQDWGDEVILAASVDEALARTAGGAYPDVILADYRLRGGALGTDAIVRVRAALGRMVPGVLLTGDTGEDTLADAERPGFVVASKPIGSRELARVLRQATG